MATVLEPSSTALRNAAWRSSLEILVEYPYLLKVPLRRTKRRLPLPGLPKSLMQTAGDFEAETLVPFDRVKDFLEYAFRII